MHNYPSDITREQFEIIRPDLENAKKKHAQENMICTIFFVLFFMFFAVGFNGECKDFPSWKLVYYYFTVWSKPEENGVSLLDKILKKIGRN